MSFIFVEVDVKRDFLSISDLDRGEINEIIDYGIYLKGNPFSDRTLEKKSIGLVFMKPSTGEDIKDTARVLSRYLDGLVIRTYAHREVEELAKFSSFPVINALTDLHHPCQVLSDFMTIKEIFGRLEGLKITYVGDGNNMANSWIVGAPIVGMNISVATPEGFEPNGRVVAEGIKLAELFDSEIEITNDPVEAVKDADIIYTDVWVSMGQENEKDKTKEFYGFQINRELLSKTGKEAIVMHCLPAHKGQEISEDIFEQFADIIFTQAENRLHAQKSLMSFLFK